MLTHWLKIAVRTLRRHLGHTAINLFGLALGLGCALLLLLFVQDELSYDRFHEHADHIYRVLHEAQREGQTAVSDMEFMGLSMMADFPEVEHAVQLYQGLGFVKHEAQPLLEQITLAGPAFFEMFSFPLKEGTPEQALRTPNAVVLSEATARKYFGDAPALGQPLSIKLGEGTFETTVTGVAYEAPDNSSIKFDVVVPIEMLREASPGFKNASWHASGPRLFVQLRDGTQAADVEAKIPTLIKAHAPEPYWSTLHRLQPLRKVHLATEVRVGYGGLEPPSNPMYLYLLAGLAGFILIIACANYTTLAIAASTRRAREVGVRKVLGAARTHLMKQFWSETILMSSLALGLGLVFAALLLPAFNTLTAKTLTLATWTDPAMLLGFVGLVLLVALLAGSYPAVLLSHFRPAEVLKGMITIGGRRRLTRVLVVVQFALAVFLLISTLFVWRQFDLLQTKDLGFNDEQVVRIATHETRGGDALLDRYRKALAAYPAVVGVTGSWQPLGTETMFGSAVMRSGDVEFQGQTFRVDRDFVKTLEITLSGGRDLSEQDQGTPGPNFLVENMGVLVNETLVKAMGWDAPVGQSLAIQMLTEQATVVGVVEDFHIQSFHHPIRPLVLHMKPGWPTHYIFVRMAPENAASTLALLEDTWHRIAPDSPFDYSFLDEAVDGHHQTEKRWSRIVACAALFAILIACLGLFGLASAAAEQRTKEIGVRKVLGASATDIVVLLSKGLALLVFVAFAVAAPLAYLAVERWLESFAYKIDVGAGTFVLAGMLALAVALVTVSYRAVKAALTDPVESLRYE